MKTSTIKASGIHYTPPELATFLARVTVEHLGKWSGRLAVLDPACGDGALLHAFAQVIPEALRNRLTLVGYETDADALIQSEKLLDRSGVRHVILRQQDFLSVARRSGPSFGQQLSLLADDEPNEHHSESMRFDAVIANPPYVRTQVLGARKSQELTRQFGLSGRVDLYHAFTKAMARVLKPEGVLGLLTSNRFLTIRSGVTLRHLLRTEFKLRSIYDLGDTKLFSAAVLPAIVVARKTRCNPVEPCSFDRVYEHRSDKMNLLTAHDCPSVIDAIRDRRIEGLIRTPKGRFRIERGVLMASGAGETWSLSTPEYDDWLKTVRSKQVCTFDDIAYVRVGIKTTADDVFIRDRWQNLPRQEQPESELIHPLIRHCDAARWRWTGQPQQFVVYPHKSLRGKRTPIDLADYPRAEKYFETHRERLTKRQYVIDGGRRWYEIWVPHDPAEWKKPKIVFPDISEEPCFFLDETGAIVNGDCYWITLRERAERSWLLLMLAIANSTFITRFYDITFHNKLYAGRRRFMTQYVKNFPLPDTNSILAKRIIQLADQIVRSREVESEAKAEIDALIWNVFGLSKEIPW